MLDNLSRDSHKNDGIADDQARFASLKLGEENTSKWLEEALRQKSSELALAKERCARAYEQIASREGFLDFLVRTTSGADEVEEISAQLASEHEAEIAGELASLRRLKKDSGSEAQKKTGNSAAETTNNLDLRIENFRKAERNSHQQRNDELAQISAKQESVIQRVENIITGLEITKGIATQSVAFGAAAMTGGYAGLIAGSLAGGALGTTQEVAQDIATGKVKMEAGALAASAALHAPEQWEKSTITAASTVSGLKAASLLAQTPALLRGAAGGAVYSGSNSAMQTANAMYKGKENREPIAIARDFGKSLLAGAALGTAGAGASKFAQGLSARGLPNVLSAGIEGTLFTGAVAVTAEADAILTGHPLSSDERSAAVSNAAISFLIGKKAASERQTAESTAFTKEKKQEGQTLVLPNPEKPPLLTSERNPDLMLSPEQLPVALPRQSPQLSLPPPVPAAVQAVEPVRTLDLKTAEHPRDIFNRWQKAGVASGEDAFTVAKLLAQTAMKSGYFVLAENVLDHAEERNIFSGTSLLDSLRDDLYRDVRSDLRGKLSHGALTAEESHLLDRMPQKHKESLLKEYSMLQRSLKLDSTDGGRGLELLAKYPQLKTTALFSRALAEVEGRKLNVDLYGDYAIRNADISRIEHLIAEAPLEMRPEMLTAAAKAFAYYNPLRGDSVIYDKTSTHPTVQLLSTDAIHGLEHLVDRSELQKILSKVFFDNPKRHLKNLEAIADEKSLREIATRYKLRSDEVLAMTSNEIFSHLTSSTTNKDLPKALFRNVATLVSLHPELSQEQRVFDIILRQANGWEFDEKTLEKNWGAFIELVHQVPKLSPLYRQIFSALDRYPEQQLLLFKKSISHALGPSIGRLERNQLITTLLSDPIDTVGQISRTAFGRDALPQIISSLPKSVFADHFSGKQHLRIFLYHHPVIIDQVFEKYAHAEPTIAREMVNIYPKEYLARADKLRPQRLESLAYLLPKQNIQRLEHFRLTEAEKLQLLGRLASFYRSAGPVAIHDDLSKNLDKHVIQPLFENEDVLYGEGGKILIQFFRNTLQAGRLPEIWKKTGATREEIAEQLSEIIERPAERYQPFLDNYLSANADMLVTSERLRSSILSAGLDELIQNGQAEALSSKLSLLNQWYYFRQSESAEAVLQRKLVDRLVASGGLNIPEVINGQSINLELRPANYPPYFSSFLDLYDVRDVHGLRKAVSENQDIFAFAQRTPQTPIQLTREEVMGLKRLNYPLSLGESLKRADAGITWDFAKFQVAGLGQDPASSKLFEAYEQNHIYDEDRGTFRMAVAKFGFAPMLSFLKAEGSDSHTKLEQIPKLLDLIKDSKRTGSEVYYSLLDQIARDSGRYGEEQDLSSFEMFNRILAEVTLSKEEIGEVKTFASSQNLPTLLEFSKKMGTKYSILGSWNNLKDYYHVKQMLGDRAFIATLSNLHRQGEHAAARYFETLGFSPNSSVPKDMINLMATRPDGFISLPASHTDYRLQSIFSPKNYLENTPFMDLSAADLTLGIASGNLDKLQLFQPLQVTYRIPLVNNEVVTSLSKLTRLAVGAPRQGITPLSASQPKLVHELRSLLKDVDFENQGKYHNLSAGEKMTPLFAFMAGEKPLNPSAEWREKELKIMELLTENPQTRIPGVSFEEYIAEVHKPSDPLAEILRHQIGGCDRFGDGKGTNYLLNPQVGFFSLSKLINKGRRRGISQSTLTRNVETNSFPYSNFFPGADNESSYRMPSVGSLVGDTLHRPNQRRFLTLDNIQTAPNYQNENTGKLIPDLLADFFTRYQEAYPDLNMDGGYALIGENYSHGVSELAKVMNRSLPESPVMYSDNIQEKSFALPLGRKSFAGLVASQQKQNAGTDSPGKNSPGLNENMAGGNWKEPGVAPLSPADILPLGVVDENAFIDRRGRTIDYGLDWSQLGNWLIASYLNNGLKSRPSLSYKVSDDSGRMKGFLLAYEGRGNYSLLSDNIQTELYDRNFIWPRDDAGKYPLIYLADYAVLPEAQAQTNRLGLAGGRLINKFMDDYARHYLGQGKLYPIYGNLRDKTSLSILKKQKKRLEAKSGLTLHLILGDEYGEGEGQGHEVMIIIQPYPNSASGSF